MNTYHTRIQQPSAPFSVADILRMASRLPYIQIFAVNIFCQFYDAQYVKKNDNNFHISPPISYLRQIVFLFINFPAMYNIIIYKAK